MNKEITVKQRNKREGNVKEAYLPGRQRNKKEGFDNRLQQLHSRSRNTIEGGYNPATQKKHFKQYLQLSLFPNIVPHQPIINVLQNGNNKQASITKDG